MGMVNDNKCDECGGFIDVDEGKDDGLTRYKCNKCGHIYYNEHEL